MYRRVQLVQLVPLVLVPARAGPRSAAGWPTGRTRARRAWARGPPCRRARRSGSGPPTCPARPGSPAAPPGPRTAPRCNTTRPRHTHHYHTTTTPHHTHLESATPLGWLMYRSWCSTASSQGSSRNASTACSVSRGRSTSSSYRTVRHRCGPRDLHCWYISSTAWFHLLRHCR